MGLAEFSQTLRFPGETSLNFEDVKKGLSTDFTRMGAEENILAGLYLHLVGKSDGIFELKVLQESLSELREAVGIRVFLTDDERECDRL